MPADNSDLKVCSLLTKRVQKHDWEYRLTHSCISTDVVPIALCC